MYDIPILPEACWITQQWPTGKCGAIIPDLCVYITLQYLPGGSYMDIFFLGILQSSFFHLLWKTIKAINDCTELQITWPNTKKQQIECACGFTSIRTNCALHECVAVLDGYYLQTITPLKKEVHNVQSYFFSHYQTYGKLLVTTIVTFYLLVLLGQA